MLYEALTGEPPFAGTTTSTLIAAHLNTPPPQPSTTQPNVPAQVDEVIATGMAKDPDQRYATTVELADAARDAITVPIPRPTPTPTQPATEHAASPATLPATEQARNFVTAQPTTVKALAPAKPGGHATAGRSRKRWLIPAAAAAALVTVGVIAAIIGLSPGQTKPGAHTTFTTAAPIVAPDRLDSILLSVQDINTIMGATDMQPAGPISSHERAAPVDCVQSGLPGSPV